MARAAMPSCRAKWPISVGACALTRAHSFFITTVYLGITALGSAARSVALSRSSFALLDPQGRAYTAL